MEIFEHLERFLVIFRTLPKNFKKLQRVLESLGDLRRFLDSFGTLPRSFVEFCDFWRFPRSLSEFRRFLDIFGEFSETSKVF